MYLTLYRSFNEINERLLKLSGSYAAVHTARELYGVDNVVEVDFSAAFSQCSILCFFLPECYIIYSFIGHHHM